MKLKDVKRMLDKMSREELEHDLVVIADGTQSGVGVAKKAKCALYWTGEDDPSELKTR